MVSEGIARPSHVCPHDMGKRSAKSVTFNPKPQIFAANLSGTSGYDFTAVAGSPGEGPSGVSDAPPDLDIVSGFAFLSFESLNALELHIEVNEANTPSISVQVGQKRSHDSRIGPSEGTSGVNSPPKKSRTQREKKTSSNANAKQSIKKKTKPKKGLVTTQECPPNADSHSVPVQKGNYLPNAEGPLETEESAEEISLLCSETVPEDEIREVRNPVRILASPEFVETELSTGMCQQHDAQTSSNVIMPKKKKKKKKKKEPHCDQTSQTMFRIKKKKKTQSTANAPADATHFAGGCRKNAADLQKKVPLEYDAGVYMLHTSNIEPKNTCVESCSIAAEPIEDPECADVEEDPLETEFQAVDMEGGCHTLTKPQRSKIEKIDWCARTGGNSSLTKYRKLRARPQPVILPMVQEEKLSEEGELDSTSSTIGGSDLEFEDFICDVKLGETSHNETTDEIPKEYLFRNETFVMGQENAEDMSDGTDIDIESVDKVVSKNFLVVSGIKGTVDSPVGHFSFHPERTREGTVDSSIQAYANEIEVYMKCAMLQHGEIIKIMTPDKDEETSVERKYLQDPDNVKAVRSLTERKRRNVLGQMFINLKMEVFTDLVDKELYFSKQTILTKAIATIDELLKQSKELAPMKSKLIAENTELRKRLSTIIFGHLATKNQVIDIEKLSSILKRFNIEVKEPPKDLKKKDDAHLTKTVSSSTASATQFTTSVYHDKERGLYTLVKATTEASVKESSTATASKPKPVKEKPACTASTSAITAPCSVPQMITATKSTYPRLASRIEKSIPCQTMDPSSKIVCNLSRFDTQRSSNSTPNICVITNVNPAMKSLESKNVMHIKISNDVLKKIEDKSGPSSMEQKPANVQPGNPSTVVACKPQVMLGTLIAKKIAQQTSIFEKNTSQVRTKQSGARPLRPILPLPPANVEVLSGVNKIVSNVNSPSVLQQLSLNQQPGSSIPALVPQAQGKKEGQEVNKPTLQGTQASSDLQSASGIDGLQDVVDKLSREQKSFSVPTGRKIMVSANILSNPKAEIHILPVSELSTLPGPVHLVRAGVPILNVPSGQGGVPSSIQSSVTGSIKVDSARCLGIAVSVSQAGATTASATSTKASQRISSPIQSGTSINTVCGQSTSTVILPVTSRGVHSTVSFVAPKPTAKNQPAGGNMPFRTESVPITSPLSVGVQPASVPGSVLSSVPSPASISHTTVTPVLQTSMSPSVQATRPASTPAQVTATLGTNSHNQVAIKSPLSNVQRFAPLASPSTAPYVARSSTGTVGVVNPMIVQRSQGLSSFSPSLTSSVNCPSPCPRIMGSTFQNVSSAPVTVTIPSVSMVMPSPTIIQLPLSPVMGSVRMPPEAPAHSNAPVHIPMVTAEKPLMSTCQANRVVEQALDCDSLIPSLGNQPQKSSSLVEPKNLMKNFPEIKKILSSLDVSQVSQIETRGFPLPIAEMLPTPDFSHSSADIVRPQVHELRTSMVPVSHSGPAAGAPGSRAEESSNIPSAFVTRIPVTDWTDSVDIPFLVDGGSLLASEQAATVLSIKDMRDSTSTTGKAGSQSAGIQYEGKPTDHRVDYKNLP